MSNTSLLWKPWDEANFADPYPMYKKLQQIDSVHLSQTKEWIITRYEDVKSILKDNRYQAGNRLAWIKRGVEYLNTQEMDFQAIAQAMSHFILFLNPPQHTRVRKFIQGVWVNHDIENLFRLGAKELISKFNKEKFNVVKEFGQALPALTMTNILGIDSADHRYLKDLALKLIKALDLYITVKDLVLIHHASKEFIEYFRITMREKKMHEEGLLYKIFAANEKSQEPLSEAELISICIFLFTAGEETTSGLIGVGVYHLTKDSNAARSSQEWDLAIDELLRFNPPVQLLGRIASCDMNVHGKTIPNGSTVTLCLGAANRDPEIFDRPDELILNRTQNRHLAFGSGIHFCLGDWLGKLQSRIALEELFLAFPGLHLATDELNWNKNLAIRSLTSLEVTIK